MKAKPRFFTSCVGWRNGRDINDMVYHKLCQDITLDTFRRRVDPTSFSSLQSELGYAVGQEKGLHLKDDWAVSYHKSVFRGKPCYYLRWSSIEYIFI